MQVRWLPTVIFALACALLGSHFGATPEMAAGAPFAYVPPQGFIPVDLSTKLDSSVIKAWIEPSILARSLDARITLSHSSHVADLGEAALSAISAGMPALYAKSQGQWTEERHLVHHRPDGASVGLIVGALTTADGVSMRTMQMLFPDDTGSSIVTASFETSLNQRMTPEIEKSMDDATGVKKLGKSASSSIILAWALGGLLFAIAAQVVIGRRKSA